MCDEFVDLALSKRSIKCLSLSLCLSENLGDFWSLDIRRSTTSWSDSGSMSNSQVTGNLEVVAYLTVELPTL